MSDAETSPKPAKRKVGRSPAYPYISVQKAIDQARALFDQEGEYEAPLTSAAGAWGYSPKSSGGRQTLATMKYYGLIDISGEGDARKIRVSDIAKRIILDKREDDSEKRALIRKVALTPAAHKKLYDQYPNGLASDNSVEHFLVFDEGFKPDGAKDLIAEYKETATFAGVYQPSETLDKSDDSDNLVDDDNNPVEVKVGDRVQVTINGVDQFKDGTTVVGFSDDREFVFVDQSTSGVPVKDISIMEQAGADTVTPPPMPAHLQASLRQAGETPLVEGTRKAMFPLDEGDVTLIFPEGISTESLEDLDAYLSIFLKKEIKKSQAD
ncbi:hypothetical protein BPTFM16_01099 [Altererythrobacter insulae]|nr:hypothetical protein BPTFM16_01099 [Altererythrobacter insulae]